MKARPLHACIVATVRKYGRPTLVEEVQGRGRAAESGGLSQILS